MAVQLASHSSKQLLCPRIPREIPMSAPGTPLLGRRNKAQNNSTSSLVTSKVDITAEVNRIQALEESKKKSYFSSPLNALGETLTDLMKSLDFSNVISLFASNKTLIKLNH